MDRSNVAWDADFESYAKDIAETGEAPFIKGWIRDLHERNPTRSEEDIQKDLLKRASEIAGESSVSFSVEMTWDNGHPVIK